VIKRIIVAAVAGILFAAGSVLTTSPAYAGPVDFTPCYHDSCNGKDPGYTYNSHTGAVCSSGAYNVLSSNIYYQSTFEGTLQLRWGPNCGTNWTRFLPATNREYQIWVTRLSDGLFAGHGLYQTYMFSGGSGGVYYSDQVYSPGPAQACVQDDSVGQYWCLSQ
jgi:Protein of unknown function (DUF2690)